MHALTSMHGWGWLLMIAGIFGWSALMLLLVYLTAKLWRPRLPAPTLLRRDRPNGRGRGSPDKVVPVGPRDWTRG